MDMDDLFAQFFGHGRHGGGSKFGGGGGFEREEKIEDLFENTDVETLDLSKVFQFYRRQEIWIMYFFNPKLQECKDFKETYVSVAEKLYGMIKVGAIDCLREEELCEEFSAFDVP